MNSALASGYRGERAERAGDAFWRYALSRLAYPAVMVSAVSLFFVLRGLDWSPLFASYASIATGALCIVALETLIPYRREWRHECRRDWQETKNDAVFMVFIQMLLPKLLAAAAAFAVVGGLERVGMRPSFWPGEWNLGAQVALMLLATDFLRYWLHRLFHERKGIWRFHAVHHFPGKLYWLNVGRFHPVDKGLQFLADALPFIVLGASAEVLALYLVLYAVNGFFQHSNTDVRLGFLNWIVSGPELHRWHHSRKISESNRNYGNNLAVWDVAFGTRFLPKDREVGKLGLLNPAYPASPSAQMRAAFTDLDKRDAPLPSWRGLLLNLLLALRMRAFKRALYLPLARAARDPAAAQEHALLAILRRNANTEFGRAHGFASVRNAAEYRARVSLHDYEALRPLIERQEKTGAAVLTASRPVLYNRTSGTTGAPKDVPVLPETLDALRRAQRVFAWAQYDACPEAFRGALLGLVSPAVEGALETGTPYGSASGHLYKSMPMLARAKYVLPPEVFEIEDADLKYAVIARLAVARADITYLASANPSSFHRLLDGIRAELPALAAEIAAGTCRHLGALQPAQAAAVRARLAPDPVRAREIERLAQDAPEAVTYATLWPWIRLVSTWTGGSCGISLESLRAKLPAEARVIDVGYVASEMRGTITLSPESSAGLPDLRETFFEFVEREAWDARENESVEFIGLEALVEDREYLVFVTTSGGLYRYPMNDVVRAEGRLRSTPLLRFLQKGKGVTNITGEKVYESQLLAAVRSAESGLGLRLRFWQALADEREGVYTLYVEAEGGDKTASKITNESESASASTGPFDACAFSARVDAALAEGNVEYAAKLKSGRLKPLRAMPLRAGASDAYKADRLAHGQRESQFKPVALQYQKESTFAFETWEAE